MAQKKKAEKKSLPTPKEGQEVRVVNRGGRDGYRRAGIKHPKGRVDHPHDTFDAEQLEALANDHKLEVQVVDAPKGDEQQ